MIWYPIFFHGIKKIKFKFINESFVILIIILNVFSVNNGSLYLLFKVFNVINNKNPTKPY